MTDQTSDEELKPLIRAQFFMKSGSVMNIDNLTELKWSRNGEEITELTWAQDTTRGTSKRLGFISLPQIESLFYD